MRVRDALLLLVFVPALLGNELGRPLLQTFPTTVFTRIQMPSAPLQDDDGRLYFGDFSAATVYDGTTWSAVEMPFAKLVAALARAADGTIYGGGHLRLGRFQRVPGNRYEFFPLENNLPAQEREFGDVQLVTPLADGTICFAASRKLLLWNPATARFTTIDHGGATAWTVNGDVYLVGGGVLRRFESGRIVPVSSDPLFARTRISFLLPGAEPDTILVGTFDRGLFTLRNGRTVPWPTNVGPRLQREHLVAGARLADGSLALALGDARVLLVGADGGFVDELGPEDGLGGSVIRALGTDREGGLWICQAQLLTRAQWPSGFTLFDSRNGLPKAPVRTIVRENGVLYAGTFAGVYRLVPGDAAATRAHFEPVAGSSGSMQYIVQGPTGILAVTPTQVFELTGQLFHPALTLAPPSRAGAYLLLRSTRDPDRIWIGQAEGLRSIRHGAGGWTDEGWVPGLQRLVSEILEEADGTVWVANFSDGFARLRFRPGGADPRGVAQVDTFFGGHGLPAKLAGNNGMLDWDGAPLFTTDYAAYRFDAATGRFLPYTGVGERLNRPPLVLAMFLPATDDHFWLRAYTTPPGPGEIRGRRFFLISRDGTWRAVPHYVNDAVGAGRGGFEEGPRDHRVMWIPGAAGLVRIEVPAAFPQPRLSPVLISAEASAAGETWSDEMPSVDATDPRTTPNATHPIPARWITAADRVPYARRDVRFHYVAPRLQLDAAPEYQTWLEGYDAGWTGLRVDLSRTVTNLPEGRYRLHVRAQDSDGQFTPESTFAFVVLPPWWRTWWAFAAYALGAAGVLAGTVRWRVRALQRRNEQLEATVATRTHELRASEAELRVARDAAEAANRAKSAFLANMSHELRTPLNAILGYTQIMQREFGPEDRNRPRLDQVAQSGEHLLRLINDVLDLSKIEAGRIDLQPHPCALRKLVSSLNDFFQLRAAQKSLGFAYVQPAPLPEWVIADEHRLRQVLANLLGNALKFTERGRIELHVVAEGDRIRFEVRDTGIGIAPEDRSRIFEPFQQTVLPQLAAQGAGLGLAISQRLVRLMGGDLQVESTPGLGSRFWFAVPLPEIPAPAGAADLTRTITGLRGSTPRVLIVDDEPANRTMLREMLAGVGFEVTTAENAAAALAECALAMPAAVLLDLRMPGLDGFGLAGRLRAMSPAPKIIALSASVYPADRAQAIAAGCDDFIAKPIHEAELLAALARLLGVEWTYAETRARRSNSATPFESLLLPRIETIDTLIALADCGDVIKVSEVLRELRRSDPLLAPFADRIDALAASYQTRALSEALQRARELAHRPIAADAAAPSTAQSRSTSR